MWASVLFQSCKSRGGGVRCFSVWLFGRGLLPKFCFYRRVLWLLARQTDPRTSMAMHVLKLMPYSMSWGPLLHLPLFLLVKILKAFATLPRWLLFCGPLHLFSSR